MDKILAAIRNIYKVPELRKRIMFTLGMLLLYRIGAHITAPGINREVLQRVWNEVGYTLLGVLDLFSGGNFSTISIFALGVTPYITASIIFQLMTVVYPALKKVQEEGEMGRQKINQWTRYLTVGLAAIQTTFVAFWLQNNGIAIRPGTISFIIPTVITLTTGTIFVMWLGEQITERGIGNGISLLIFAGIVIGLPRGVTQVAERVRGGDAMATVGVLLLLAALVVLIGVIVYVESARRNIAINYAKRAVAGQIVSPQRSSLPLKINLGGVIPVIFASSVLSLPQSIFSAFPPDPNNPASIWAKVITWFRDFHGGDPYYELVFISLIIFFTFFYVSIVFNTEEVADNLRKNGGFVSSIRPGRATADYLNVILTRLTTVGAIYLALISFVPQFMLSGFKLGRLPFVGAFLDAFVSSTPGLSWIPTGLGYQFYFGGTSLLILVGVAMDTVSQIEAKLIMENYEGFLGSGSRLRGRRS